MEWFIETRFGDPVLVMDMNGPFLVYGTALGQIGYMDILSRSHTLLTEMAEECVRGIHLSDESIIYAAIGDLYVLCLFKSATGEWHMEGVNHEGRIHTSVVCNLTFVLQDKVQVCLIIVDDEEKDSNLQSEGKSKCFLTDANNSETEELNGLVLPIHSIPLDFTSDKLLWIERDTIGNRALKVLYFHPVRHHLVKYLPPDFKQVAFAQFHQDSIVFVQDFRYLKCMDILEGNVFSIGEHKNDIVSTCCFQKSVLVNDALEERMIVAAVDTLGIIRLWGSARMLEEIDITAFGCISIDSKQRLFSLGYPYVIKVSGEHISVSCDLGIFVIKSDYLGRIRERTDNPDPNKIIDN